MHRYFMIDNFISAYETFLKDNCLPHYTTFTCIHYKDNEYMTYVYNLSEKFIDEYISLELLTLDKKKQIITEYGFKRLIDLHVYLHDEKICERDLFHFETNIDNWLSIMLKDIVYLLY
jgi:hypothetical protein